MRIVITGAAGFLGWHTRCRLHALTDHEVVPISRNQWGNLNDLVQGADVVLHIAGVNRGAPGEILRVNAGLAGDLTQALSRCEIPPAVVFANSIHAGDSTEYGEAKAAAAALLGEKASEVGGTFVDVRLPNLFGEHGRPRYNSFVATFVACQVRGEVPAIQDRAIKLLHAQDAAQALIDAISCDRPRVEEPAAHPTSVREIWDVLSEFHRLYQPRGEIPVLSSRFEVALFNTYRAGLFPERGPVILDPKSDDRGRLVETVRQHGSEGQAFVSTTRPGVTRGDHYHLHKVERFAVLGGQARIAMRRMFTRDVVEFAVNGDEPVAVDMPTMWTHNITNTGRTELITQFWTNELFDPQRPDTFPVRVDSQEWVA